MATRVGTALIIFGILTFAGAFFLFNSNGSSTAVIPGGDYISFHTRHPLIDSHLSGSYSVSPGSVSIYIFTSDQFQSYSTTGFVGCLYQSYGSSGSFSVNLTGAGTYYIVAEHSRDPSIKSTDQSLGLTYSFSGILLDDLLLGIGVLALGAPIVFMGRRIRGKVRKITSETTH